MNETSLIYFQITAKVFCYVTIVEDAHFIPTTMRWIFFLLQIHKEAKTFQKLNVILACFELCQPQ